MHTRSAIYTEYVDRCYAHRTAMYHTVVCLFQFLKQEQNPGYRLRKVQKQETSEQFPALTKLTHSTKVWCEQQLQI